MTDCTVLVGILPTHIYDLVSCGPLSLVISLSLAMSLAMLLSLGTDVPLSSAMPVSVATARAPTGEKGTTFLEPSSLGGRNSSLLNYCNFFFDRKSVTLERPRLNTSTGG